MGKILKGDNNPLSLNYQMQKFGLTEEEARFKLRSRKKMCKEYWISRGYSEEDAIIEVKKFQSRAANICQKKIKENPEKYRGSFNTQLEYYLKLGYSEEDAKKILSERQCTFSLQKCIEKYGEIEGQKIFNERQNKWQNTLLSHSTEYINEMNKKKNVKDAFLRKYGEIDGLIKYKNKVKNAGKKVKQINEEKRSGKWFFDHYNNKIEAEEEWNKWLNTPNLHTYEWYIMKYGDMVGKEKYQNYINSIRLRFKSYKDGSYYLKKYGENWENIIKTKHNIGKASKESLKLFIPLYKILRKEYKYNLYDILFGIRGLKEFLIYDKKSGIRKLYDFTILSDKIIFEFNGDGKYIKNPKNKNHLLKSIHPNYNKLTEEELLKWTHPKRPILAKDKIKEDQEKINLAKEKGFNILEIWQSDGIEYNLKKCLEFINEIRSKNKRCS